MSISPYAFRVEDFMNSQIFPECDWDDYLHNLRVASMGTTISPTPTGAFTPAHIGSAAQFTTLENGDTVLIPAIDGPVIVQDTSYDAAYDSTKFIPRMLTGVVPARHLISENAGKYARWDDGELAYGDPSAVGAAGYGCVICKDALRNVSDAPWGIAGKTISKNGKYAGYTFGMAEITSPKATWAGVTSMAYDGVSKSARVVFARKLAQTPFVTASVSSAVLAATVKNITTDGCEIVLLNTTTGAVTAHTPDIQLSVFYLGELP